MSYELTILPASIFTFLIIFNFFYGYKKFQDIRVNIVNGLLIYQGLGQVTFPAIYGLVEGYRWESYYAVSPVDLFIVYCIELVFVLCWIIGFYCFTNFFRHAQQRSIIPAIADKKVDKILIFIIIFLLYGMLITHGKGLSAFGEMTIYDSTNLGESVTLWPTNVYIPFTLWSILFNTFHFSGMLTSAILITSPHSSKVEKTMAFSVLIFMILLGLTTALRQFILAEVIMILIFGLAQHNKKVLIFSLISLVALFLFAPLMQYSYRDLLMQQESKNLGFKERLSALLEIKAIESDINPFLNFWHAAGERFSDSLFSAGLVKAYLRGDSAGANPLISAILSPIPRFFWPDKPVPGSSDGTTAGLATFVVWREAIGTEWGICGSFTPSAHAFWEFGVLGVILSGIFAGMFARFILVATKLKGKIGLLIWGLSMNPLAFSVNLWTPQIFIVIFQRIIPLLIFIKCWLLVSNVLLKLTSNYRIRRGSPRRVRLTKNVRCY